MHTYFLPEEQVQGYLRDLAARLAAMGPETPTVWCPIGFSGEVLADRLLAVAPPELIEITNRVDIRIERNIDHVNHTVVFDRADSAACLRDRAVLLLDSSVHSGDSMLRAYRAIEDFDPRTICTYSLVVKQNSVFIPSLWGLMIEPHDRAYFMMPQIPNNRLHLRLPACHLHRLSDADLQRPLVITGVAALDNLTWQDRKQNMALTDGDLRTYLLEIQQRIVGFITVRLDPGHRVLIEEVGAALELATRDQQMSVLIRFATTLARHTNCVFVEAYADDVLREGLEAVGYHYHGHCPLDRGETRMHSMIKRIVSTQ